MPDNDVPLQAWKPEPLEPPLPSPTASDSVQISKAATMTEDPSLDGTLHRGSSNGTTLHKAPTTSDPVLSTKGKLDPKPSQQQPSFDDDVPEGGYGWVIVAACSTITQVKCLQHDLLPTDIAI
jgi:hypothetical protein